jgi:hypothetical protein
LGLIVIGGIGYYAGVSHRNTNQQLNGEKSSEELRASIGNVLELEKENEVKAIENETTTQKPPTLPVEIAKPQLSHPPLISSPKIDFINPAIVIGDRAYTIEVHGSGFQQNAQIRLASSKILSPSEPVTANLIKFQLPANFLIPMVRYNVEAMNPDGGIAMLGSGLEVKSSQDVTQTNTPNPPNNLLEERRRYDFSILDTLVGKIGEIKQRLSNNIATTNSNITLVSGLSDRTSIAFRNLMQVYLNGFNDLQNNTNQTSEILSKAKLLIQVARSIFELNVDQEFFSFSTSDLNDFSNDLEQLTTQYNSDVQIYYNYLTSVASRQNYSVQASSFYIPAYHPQRCYFSAIDSGGVYQGTINCY